MPNGPTVDAIGAAVARIMDGELRRVLDRLETMAAQLAEERALREAAQRQAEEAGRAARDLRGQLENADARWSGQIERLGEMRAQAEEAARTAREVRERLETAEARWADQPDRLAALRAHAEDAARTAREVRDRLEGAEARMIGHGEGLAELKGRAEILGRLKGDPGPRGEAGPPGRDGTLENPEIAWEPTANPRKHVLILRTSSGIEARTTVDIPAVIYQGAWEPGIAYQRGDAVTHDGSVWIAMAEAEARPGSSGTTGWRLAVKRGRDARP